jgi:ADP-heptose:LPS heptosyltransferase
MKNVLVNLGLRVPYRYLKSLMRRVQFLIDGFFLHNVVTKKDVALIRLDAIGDFIVWLDAAKEFRSLYPSERIVLIANKSWADLAATLNYWDDVWPIDGALFSRPGKYRLGCIKKISGHGFRLAIHPGYSRKTSLGDSVVRATKATETIAPARDLNNSVVPVKERAIADAWYSKIVPSAPGGMTELDRNAEFLRALLDGSKGFEPSLPKLPASQQKIDFGDYFVVVPGASWQGRMWSARNFSRVILSVREQYGLRAVLCGGIAEKSLCQQIVNEVKGDAVNYAGDTSLVELAGMIAGARLVLTNETSAIHFATAVDTPSVCIVGGGHFGRFVPYPEKLSGVKPVVVNFHMGCYGCNWSCTERYIEGNAVPCIERITIDNVLVAIDKALTRNVNNFKKEILWE